MLVLWSLKVWSRFSVLKSCSIALCYKVGRRMVQRICIICVYLLWNEILTSTEFARNFAGQCDMILTCVAEYHLDGNGLQLSGHLWVADPFPKWGSNWCSPHVIHHWTVGKRIPAIRKWPAKIGATRETRKRIFMPILSYTSRAIDSWVFP